MGFTVLIFFMKYIGLLPCFRKIEKCILFSHRLAFVLVCQLNAIVRDQPFDFYGGGGGVIV